LLLISLIIIETYTSFWVSNF